MSIFPRPLKKVLGKIIPFSLVDLIPTFNLGTGVASTATFLRGDQTWSTVPAISGGGGNNVNYYLNGGTAASIGTYYQMSNTPVIGTGVDFSLSGNGLITQWLTDAGNPNTTEIPAGNWNFEMFMSASSSGGVPKFYMEILKYDGSTFTTIANNSAAPENITSGTLIDLYLSSVAVPFTSLLITDRIAVRVYIVDNTPGRTITQHTQDSHLCQIITSFSSGISSINTLTKNTQYIVAGTSGSDFNVSSYVDTHTLNLPTASALKRGAVSSVDWSTFNAKQNPITLTTTGTGAATFVSDVLNIPTPSGGSGLTVGTTPITSGTIGRILFQNGSNLLAQDSALFWDNINKRLGIGATPATTARLDVRAQGALSTDIAFRVRNSADTTNLIEQRGNGQIVFSNTTSTYVLNPRTDADGFSLSSGSGAYGTGTGMEVVSNHFVINNSSTRTFRFTATSVTNLWEFKNESGQLRISPTSDTTQPTLSLNNTNVVIGGLSVGTSATKTLAIYSGTAPSTSPVDAFQQYSADIVAGNAAPHFRTENGGIIKLYKETTAVAASTFVSNTSLIANNTATFDGYTIGQVVKALRNLGILA